MVATPVQLHRWAGLNGVRVRLVAPNRIGMTITAAVTNAMPPKIIAASKLSVTVRSQPNTNGPREPPKLPTPLAIAMLAPAASFGTESATRIQYVVIRPNHSAIVMVRH